jgi:CheY-like chemotaxis protein
MGQGRAITQEDPKVEAAALREILLVEDNPADARLTIEALTLGLPGCHIRTVVNGATALAMLRQTGRYAAAIPPDLVLLDLNLPGINGHEVLAAIKADPTLHYIPVVIFSTSSDENDRKHAYALGATGYLVKPQTWDEYRRIAETVQRLYHGFLYS